MSLAQDTDDQPATDPAEARVFDNVISGLRKSYPRDKMEEISTSFCFICLLHLANERGLRLETGAEEEAVDIESRVGNIWDLKVSCIVGVARCGWLTPSSPGVQRPRCNTCCMMTSHVETDL